MGPKTSYFQNTRKTIPVAIQGAGLKRIFPDSHISFKKNTITWIGQLQPTHLSQNYTVRIMYKLKERPVVAVVSPELTRRNGCRIPHMFADNELCLFRYKYFEWDSTMSIAETIVPWTSLWLLHSEIWLATGVWCGSKQEHPEPQSQKQPECSTEGFLPH